MPLTRIRQTAIGDDSITSAKLAHDLDLDGDFVRVPHGTTAQRPSSPVAGYMRFNTDQGTLEQWNTNTNSWQAIDSPPIITSLAYTGSATAADPAGGETITLTGTNFKSGANVTVGGTSATSVTVVSSTSITFTTPVKTAGDYDVIVINSNGLQATLTNGISYNGTPSFTTAAGNVGSVQEDVAMSTITIVAAEPDGGTLAFSVTSGALPTGVSLGSANGQLTGTPNTNITSDTTFNFTVTATDDESQTNARAFNLIVLRPIYSTQLANSLRFNDDDSSILYRTPSSTGNQKTFTWSGWVKRGKLTSAQYILSAWQDGSNHLQMGFVNSSGTAADTLRVYAYTSAFTFQYVTNQMFRDISSWYHIVLSVDTTQAAAGDRVKIYVNGNQITSFSTLTNPNQNVDCFVNKNIMHNLGRQVDSGSHYFDGYLSDVHLIDGQALTPTSFAEEYYGVWAPKAYSGSYGTNGFKLNFANSADIGNDVSGQNNDWTSTNFGTFDVFPDSPTINFCTLNPLMKRRDVSNDVTFYQGNLGAVYPNAGGNQTYSFGTHSMSSGKWYYEVYMFATGSNTTVGIGQQSDADAVAGGNVLYRNDGNVSTAAGGSTSGNGASYANGDVVGCAFDLDNGTVKFYKNGALQSTVTGISTTATYMPFVRGTTSEQILTNFGQDSTFSGTISAASNADANSIGNFKYTVPSDHLAICSKNFAESTINTSLDDRPEDYFDAVTYTGNGTSSSVTVGFQPDFTWIKARGATYDHQILDTVRGYGTKLLYTNLTVAEDTSNPARVTQDSNGFTTIDSVQVNANGQTYVAWNWKAGGQPTASNVATSGAMTANSVSLNGTLQSAYTPSGSPTVYPSKMSINTKAGFSIVSYTEPSGSFSIPHGLSEAPDAFFFKSTSASENWIYWHKKYGTPTTNGLYLNSTNGSFATGSNWLTGVDGNLITQTSGQISGQNNKILYAFNSIAGYSRIGFYQSSGFADGVFVELGFKPAWIMIKSTSAGRNWTIWDNVRGHANSVGAGNNPNTTTLFANSTAIETHNTGYAVDFTANGFKTRGQGGEINTTNETMLFMAFAEDPFKYSEAE